MRIQHGYTVPVEDDPTSPEPAAAEPPTPEPTPDEKLAAVRAELQAALDAEKAKVTRLETIIAGNGDAAAPDARTRLRAIEDALKAKDIVTQAEIDALPKHAPQAN